MRKNIYNKNVLNPKGTLIENWQEEYALREFTGEGRYILTKNRTQIPCFQERRRNVIRKQSSL